MSTVAKSPPVVFADVLVIGGGGAGCEAAIFARRAGATSVCVVEKGIIGSSGCTVMGTYSCCAALGIADPRDHPRVHSEDTDAAGARIGDPEWIRIYGEEAPARVLELAEWGVPFEKEGGRLKQGAMPGHTYPRAVFVDMHTGQAMQIGLRRKLERTPGVRRVNDVQVYRLLVAEGRVYGAVGLCRRTLAPIHFLANATVLATGGCGQLYAQTSTSLDNTGDGLAVAFAAGAPLMDMEFIQFFPLSSVHPVIPGRNRTVTTFLRHVPGSRLRNNRGEDFISGKYPTWQKTLTRDLFSQAIYREIHGGRGSPHGGVFMDVTAASEEEIERTLAFGGLYRRIKEMGVNLKKDTVEVGVAAHFLMGGLKARAHGETNLPGLLVAGEAMAGIHGANRLGGNALSEILVTGSRAGTEAARLASGEKGRFPSFPAETEWEEWIAGLLSKPGDGQVPGRLKKSLQDCMWRHAGVIRTGAGLKKGLEIVKGLQEAMEKEMALSYGRRPYHMELQDAIETRLMLDIARSILIAAERREETRGAQMREDFPETREDWRANLVLTKGQDGITCEKRGR